MRRRSSLPPRRAAAIGGRGQVPPISAPLAKIGRFQIAMQLGAGEALSRSVRRRGPLFNQGRLEAEPQARFLELDLDFGIALLREDALQQG